MGARSGLWVAARILTSLRVWELSHTNSPAICSTRTTSFTERRIIGMHSVTAFTFTTQLFETVSATIRACQTNGCIARLFCYHSRLTRHLHRLAARRFAANPFQQAPAPRRSVARWLKCGDQERNHKKTLELLHQWLPREPRICGSMPNLIHILLEQFPLRCRGGKHPNLMPMGADLG